MERVFSYSHKQIPNLILTKPEVSNKMNNQKGNYKDDIKFYKYY